ncbi:MAG: hypothetical protein ACFE0R_12615 [Salinarimonas sp.]
MSRLAASFVLGFHGCDAEVGRWALDGELDLVRSDKAHDWLGPGIYFWEADPLRALEWARWKVERGDYREPFVVGAIIDLGNCLNLLERENIGLLKLAHANLVGRHEQAGLEMPRNRDPSGVGNRDKLLRFLDCAVIKMVHQAVEEQVGGPQLAPFDTVRGLFVEGEPAYPGATFYERTHTQIAVVEPSCIKGVFRPTPYPELP